MENFIIGWLVHFVFLIGLAGWIWRIFHKGKRGIRHCYMYGGQYSPVTVEIETDKPIVNGHIRIFWYGERLVDMPCENIKSLDHEE